MADNSSILIPSSIQRVKCFMNKEGRFKVKPWAGTDEILDSFFALLSNRANDDAFWKNLQMLLKDITKDVKYRLSLKDRAIDNEVLNSDRYDVLLDEIRAAVSGATIKKGAFKTCIGKLSLQSSSLLFLMGGVAALGCSDKNPSDTTGTEVSYDTETAIDTGTDTSINTDVTIETDSDTSSDTEANTDTQSDTEDTSQYRTLEEIVTEVISDEPYRAQVLSCIEGLNDSWHDGLEELFQNEEDAVIKNRIDRCLMVNYLIDFCNDPESAGEYNVDALLNNCVVPIYIGVRFE